MNILFINACVREKSRTLMLADFYLKRLSGKTKQIDLQNTDLYPLDNELLSQRDCLLHKEDLSHRMFQYAHDFAAAGQIVIAAPYWDMSFPALLKIYLENITVAGITFRYENNMPHGLCRAEKLTYITTAGGPIISDFGYSYVKALAQNFYGINNTVCLKAENLDIDGADPEIILEEAKKNILTNMTDR